MQTPIFMMPVNCTVLLYAQFWELWTEVGFTIKYKPTRFIKKKIYTTNNLLTSVRLYYFDKSLNTVW